MQLVAFSTPTPSPKQPPPTTPPPRHLPPPLWFPTAAATPMAWPFPYKAVTSSLLPHSSMVSPPLLLLPKAQEQEFPIQHPAPWIAIGRPLLKFPKPAHMLPMDTDTGNNNPSLSPSLCLDGRPARCSSPLPIFSILVQRSSGSSFHGALPQQLASSLSRPPPCEHAQPSAT